MEPLLTISYNLGNEYPHEAVAEIWKLLFENAAHDSIGSCISDTANEDVYVRYKQARDIAVNLVELHSRLIATNVKNDADMTFTAINTLPQKRKDTVIVKTYVPGGKFAIIDEKGNDVDYTIIKSRDLQIMFYHRRSCLIHPENFMYQIRSLKSQWQSRQMMCQH